MNTILIFISDNGPAVINNWLTDEDRKKIRDLMQKRSSRKAALDDPNYSAMTTDEDALIYSNLANGSLYETMNINEDGTFNYKDAEGNDKLFSDFRVEKQGFTGQQTYLGLVEDLQKNALIEGATFESLEGKYQGTIDSLFDKLGPRGSLDYAFADDTFMKKYMEDNNKELNDLKKNPGNLVETYKQYNMDQLKENIGSIEVNLSEELLSEIDRIQELQPNPAP